MVVIKLLGLANGGTTPYDETYLVRFDYQDCAAGEANLITDADPQRAMVFADQSEALSFWKQDDPRAPIRPDGRPNRPLTAYTVMIEHCRRNA